MLNQSLANSLETWESIENEEKNSHECKQAMQNLESTNFNFQQKSKSLMLDVYVTEDLEKKKMEKKMLDHIHNETNEWKRKTIHASELTFNASIDVVEDAHAQVVSSLLEDVSRMQSKRRNDRALLNQHQKSAGKYFKRRERASRIWKHCSYRQ